MDTSPALKGRVPKLVRLIVLRGIAVPHKPRAAQAVRCADVSSGQSLPVTGGIQRNSHASW